MSFRMLSTFDLKTSNYCEPSEETKLKVGLYNGHKYSFHSFYLEAKALLA